LEKYHEVLPTTIPGLLIMARDIYRDLGLSREERDDQIEALKMLSVEVLRNYIKTQILDAAIISDAAIFSEVY
jgi:hypothetical protein